MPSSVADPEKPGHSVTPPAEPSAPVGRRSMRRLSLTVDYEIFGNGTGDIRRHAIEPMERMCRVADRFGFPITIFFEIEEYLQFERHATELKQLLGYDPAAEMRQQVTDLVRRGHDFQLHFHPQWHRAKLDAHGHWDLEMQHLTVDSLFKTQEETTAYVRQRKEALEALSGRPVNVYRAGGFAIQPGQRMLTALAENGFVVDSSVVKGLHRDRPHPLDYRGAPAASRHWRISADAAQQDAEGRLWEVPVYSVMGRRWQQLTFGRLKAKFSRSVPKERQRDMMDELGVKMTPLGLLSFLRQPVPIKLDFHNLTPGALMRMITKAPPAPAGDLDALVLIGHTNEHADDDAFGEFLSRVAAADPKLEVVSMGELARRIECGTRSL